MKPCKECYSHASGAGLETRPQDMNSEHQTVKSRLTGKDHEIMFGPLPAHSDPSMGGNMARNPFASKAQMRKFFAMESRGDLPKGTAENWAHETRNIKHLPEHKK